MGEAGHLSLWIAAAIAGAVLLLSTAVYAVLRRYRGRRSGGLALAAAAPLLVAATAVR